MKKTILIILLGIFSIVSVSTVMSSSEWGEKDDDDHHGEAHPWGDHDNSRFLGTWMGSRADIAPVENQAYRNECGSCHFAFQPGLLPASAWARIVDGLSDHYGDDASLDARQTAEIRSYLVKNAADNATRSRSRAFAAGPTDHESLPRITQTNYFKREHYEIPPRLVGANPQVRSFSNCQSCHRTADAGVYNEHQVVIPGVGRWDD
jgi:hypothetical protein